MTRKLEQLFQVDLCAAKLRDPVAQTSHLQPFFQAVAHGLPAQF
jgi:hypothetical protein